MATHDLPDHLPKIAPPVGPTERKPVDVLAKLDRIADLPLHECDDARNQAALQVAKREAVEVRAAVAELVDEDKRVRIVLDTWERAVADFKGQSATKSMMAICAKELRAALVRVGGAK